MAEADIKIVVRGDYQAKLGEKAKRDATEVQKAFDQVDPDIEVDIATGEAHRRIGAVDDDLASLDGEVEVVADTAAALRDLDDLDDRADIDGDVTLDLNAGGVERDLDRIGSAADIVGRLDLDTSDLARLDDDLKRARAEARRVLGDIESAADIKGEVDLDTAKARAALRDLESIPPPRIDIETNATEAVDGIEGAFSGIDLGDLGGSVADQVGSALSMAGPVGAAVGAAAMLFGDELAEGMAEGFGRNESELLDSVRYGLDPHEIRIIGDTAGAAWADGFGDGLADVRETASLLENTLAGLDDSLDLSNATRQAEALEEVFGIDIPTAINLARRLVVNGLAQDTDEAFRLMADAAQRYQLDIDEILEVATEFSPVFGKMGVDGATAFDIIGTTVKEGLLPNVDRAAELFEEFNIEMTDGAGRARPVVERLGLSFEEMQDKLADGRGAEAMAEIATALLGVGDEATRNQLAMELFGASIESASDPQRVLELLAMADATGEVGTALDDATDAVEANQTALDRMKRGVVEGVAAWASFADQGLGVAIAAYDEFNGAVEGAVDAVARWAGAGDEGTTMAQLLAEEIKRVANELEAGDYDGAAAGLENVGEEAGYAATELDDTATAAQRVTDALAAWADDSGAHALREVYGAAEELTEGLDEATGAAYDLTSGWDLTTEAGIRGSEMAGDYRSRVAELTQAVHDGKLSQEDWAAAMDHARVELEAAMRQAGFTEEQIADLTDELFNVPELTEPEVNAVGDAWFRTGLIQDELATVGATSVFPNVDARGNAWSKAEDILGKLDSINGKSVSAYINTYETTYVTTQYRTKGSSGFRRSGGVSTAAAGGARNDLVLVGEEGPELLRLGVGSQVYSTSDTDAMMMATLGGQRRTLGSMGGGGGGGAAPVHIHITNHGSVLAERDLRGLIADALRRGGIDSIGGLR